MPSSDDEATNKRNRAPSSSKSSDGKRIRVSSPTTLASPYFATMADSHTVARPLSTLPVPETAQLQQVNNAFPEAKSDDVQQQDDDAEHDGEPEDVQQHDTHMVEAEPQNVQQEDDDIDEDEPENDQLQVGLLPGNAVNDVLEAQPSAPAPAPTPVRRREILVLSLIDYAEFSLPISVGNRVGAVLANECISWLHLAHRIRLIYNRVADQQAAADLVIPRGYTTPNHSWPGRNVWFFSQVDGEWFLRDWLEDDWVDLDIANNLIAIMLKIPKGRACRIVEGFADGTEGEPLDQIVIQNMPSWEDFSACIREVYYRVLLDQVLPELEVEELSPFNCCPGADVTFWGDLREQWFCRTCTRDSYDQQTWLAARLGICKVRITRN